MIKGSVWNLFSGEAKVTDDIQKSLDEVKSIRKVSYTMRSELQNSLQIKECFLIQTFENSKLVLTLMLTYLILRKKFKNV